jgi:hypothetical protein
LDINNIYFVHEHATQAGLAGDRWESISEYYVLFGPWIEGLKALNIFFLLSEIFTWLLQHGGSKEASSLGGQSVCLEGELVELYHLL